MTSVSRVLATDAALDLIARLKTKHGPLMFHQSGGCCDGSSPMCYPEGDLLVGDSDVRVQEAFPELPLTWLEFEHGGGGVFLLRADDLKRTADGR